MPRYEYSEGTSNKFWDITLSGKSFTTTYGKIGSNGQTTIKSFNSDSEAKSQYEKLIAEKVKKGYIAVGGGDKKKGKAGKADDKKPAKGAAAKAATAAIAAGDKRNKDLEAAIIADPSNRDAYAVYGDWLQEQGDPRGELIALHLANRDKAAQQLIAKHKEYFLGPLAEHETVRDEGYNNASSSLRSPMQEKEWQKTHKQAFLWKNGFIHRVRLSHESYSVTWDGSTAKVLEEVLKHPSARFVVEFAFHSNGDPNEDNLEDIIAVLGKLAPPTTRKITFGDNIDQISWHHTGSLAKLWKGVPNLRVLDMETGEFDVGKMDAPNLEKARFITGGLSKSCGKNIANAKMPKIKHLEIYYGDDNYGGDCSIKDVKPLLDRTDLKNLEYLGLKNAMFQNDIAAAVGSSKIVKGLKTLDLSLGTMTDEGAKALLDAKSSLKHLEVLDLTRNYLSKKGIEMVKGICKKVITDRQEKADEDGDDTYYYVDVAE
jgi:uncharacterized protein (TIGR02996 family)